MERAIGSYRRDQPQQAGAAKPAVLARSRAQGAGHRPAQTALPLGGDEPLLVGPGQGGELHWLGDALFVHALDWQDLRDDERRRIAEPVGEGRIANDSGRLKTKLAGWRSAFEVGLGACPALILDYVTTAVTALNTASIRVSPRRSRLLARSLLAANVVAGKPSSRLFRLILKSSLECAPVGGQRHAAVLTGLWAC